MMAMLEAGGIPPAGSASAPGFELHSVQDAWNLKLEGKSVKLLESVLWLGVPTAENWLFIWLDRNGLEQAKSQAKLLRATTEIDMDEDDIQTFAASFQRDRPKALGLLRKAGDVLVLRYEDILVDPLKASRKLWKRIPGFDVTAARNVVHKRDGKCRPDLGVEISGLT